MNEIPHPGFDKPEEYETFTTTNDLEEAAEEYIKKGKYLPEAFVVRPAFIAGANWQKQHDAELIEIAYNDGITIGMTKQKEQMMKAAVEGEICIPNVWVEHKEGKELVARAEISKELGFKFGDKVRIIIVKEDL